jgi:hypothetical protein
VRLRCLASGTIKKHPDRGYPGTIVRGEFGDILERLDVLNLVQPAALDERQLHFFPDFVFGRRKLAGSRTASALAVFFRFFRIFPPVNLVGRARSWCATKITNITNFVA